MGPSAAAIKVLTHVTLRRLTKAETFRFLHFSNFLYKLNAIRVLLAVAAHVNSVVINAQANMAAGARRINMGILFTNRKLPSIHSESAPRSRSV